MIITLLVVGVVAAALVAAFWSEIKKWVESSIESLLAKISATVTAISDGIVYLMKQQGQYIAKLVVSYMDKGKYYKATSTYTPQWITKEVLENEIPAEQLKQLNAGKEVKVATVQVAA